VPTVRLGGAGRERAVQACLGAAAALPQPVGVTAVGGEVCDAPPADAGRRDQEQVLVGDVGAAGHLGEVEPVVHPTAGGVAIRAEVWVGEWLPVRGRGGAGGAAAGVEGEVGRDRARPPVDRVVADPVPQLGDELCEVLVAGGAATPVPRQAR